MAASPAKYILKNYEKSFKESVYMFRKISKLVWLLSILVWPGLVQGQALSLEEVVAKIQEQYENNQDFQANFQQESFLKSLGRKQEAAGVVYFKKPGKMRWTYQKPNKQEIISDGQNLWNYRPEEKQVIVSPMSQAFQSKAPQTFLAGLGNLQKDFRARFLKDPSAGANYALEFTPVENQGSLEKLFLLVEKGSFKIIQAQIQDAMGNITTINFSKVKFNNKLSDALFHFTPPAGVEVFKMPGSTR